MSISPEKYRSVFTHLLTAILGFGVAYMAYAFQVAPSTVSEDLAGPNQVLENHEPSVEEIGEIVSNAEINSDNNSVNRKDELIPETDATSEQLLATSQTENASEESDAINIKPENAFASEQDLATAMPSFLQGTTIDMVTSGEIEPIVDEFIEWVQKSEHPAKEIYNLFENSQNDSEKHVLEWMIASQSHQGLADSLVKEISVATESEYPVWIEIMNLARIDTYEARTNLLNNLGSIENEQLVATALRAVEPMIVNPTERAEYLSGVSLYADSPSQEIKLAAIDSLSYWSAHDYDYVITNELSNGNPESQQRTLESIANGNIRSTEIKQSLLEIMDDELQSMEVRIDAFNALSGYSFEEPEYNRYFLFYQQHVQPLETQFNRG